MIIKELFDLHSVKELRQAKENAAKSLEHDDGQFSRHTERLAKTIRRSIGKHKMRMAASE